MCKAKPGDRCSYHQRIVLFNQLRTKVKTDLDLKNTTESVNSVPSGEEPPAKLVARQASLQKKVTVLDERLSLAELEYNATPDGTRELESKISEASDGPQKDRLVIDLEVARKRRAWQQTTADRLAEIEKKSGVEAAIVEAEMEQGRTLEASNKLAAQEAAVKRALLLEQHKERRRRSKQQIARLRKTLHRIRQMQRFYNLCKGDLGSFIKRKTRAVGTKYSRRTTRWFFNALKTRFDETNPPVD